MMHYVSDSQSVSLGQQHQHSPGNLLEIQIIGLTPVLLNQKFWSGP